MNYTYDAFSHLEQPTLTLCHPDDTVIGFLTDVKDFELKLEFNDVSTASFTSYNISEITYQPIFLDENSEGEYFVYEGGNYFPITLDGTNFNDEEIYYQEIISYNDIYDYIIERREVYVDGVGYFIITDVVENDSDDGKYKQVSLSSCEYELNSVKMPYIDGTYKFYSTGNFGITEDDEEIPDNVKLQTDKVLYELDTNVTQHTVGIRYVKSEEDPSGYRAVQLPDAYSSTTSYFVVNSFLAADCILYKIMSVIPHWHISSDTLKRLTFGETADGSEAKAYTDLAKEYRTFEYADKTVYDFLKNTVQESYECFVSFDIDKREIKISTYEDALVDSGFIMNKQNFLEKCEVKTKIDDYINALIVTSGDDDVNIQSANPLGTNVIYNFDHDLESGIIPQGSELHDALVAWKESCANDRIGPVILHADSNDVSYRYVELTESDTGIYYTRDSETDEYTEVNLTGLNFDENEKYYKKSTDWTSWLNTLTAKKKLVYGDYFYTIDTDEYGALTTVDSVLDIDSKHIARTSVVPYMRELKEEDYGADGLTGTFYQKASDAATIQRRELTDGTSSTRGLTDLAALHNEIVGYSESGNVDYNKRPLVSIEKMKIANYLDPNHEPANLGNRVKYVESVAPGQEYVSTYYTGYDGGEGDHTFSYLITPIKENGIILANGILYYKDYELDFSGTVEDLLASDYLHIIAHARLGSWEDNAEYWEELLDQLNPVIAECLGITNELRAIEETSPSDFTEVTLTNQPHDRGAIYYTYDRAFKSDIYVKSASYIPVIQKVGTPSTYVNSGDSGYYVWTGTEFKETAVITITQVASTSALPIGTYYFLKNSSVGSVLDFEKVVVGMDENGNPDKTISNLSGRYYVKSGTVGGIGVGSVSYNVPASDPADVLYRPRMVSEQQAENLKNELQTWLADNLLTANEYAGGERLTISDANKLMYEVNLQLTDARANKIYANTQIASCQAEILALESAAESEGYDENHLTALQKQKGVLNYKLTGYNLDYLIADAALQLLDEDYATIKDAVEISTNGLGFEEYFIKFYKDRDYSDTEAEEAGAKLYSDLIRYIRASTYNEEHITIEDYMSITEKLQQEKDLYDYCVNLLKKVSIPTTEITVDVVEFPFIDGFATTIESFNPGSVIYVEMPNGEVLPYNLLRIEMKYDDPDVVLTFSTRINLSDPASVFDDMDSATSSAASIVATNYLNWGTAAATATQLEKERNQILDATTRGITARNASTQDNVVIDGSGLKCMTQELTGDNTWVDKYGIWMSNGVILFTDDNWATTKMAVGRLVKEDGTVMYGFNGDAIMANTISTDKLTVGALDKGTNLIKDGSFESVAPSISNASSSDKWYALPDYSKSFWKIEYKLPGGEYIDYAEKPLGSIEPVYVTRGCTDAQYVGQEPTEGNRYLAISLKDNYISTKIQNTETHNSLLSGFKDKIFATTATISGSAVNMYSGENNLMGITEAEFDRMINHFKDFVAELENDENWEDLYAVLVKSIRGNFFKNGVPDPSTDPDFNVYDRDNLMKVYTMMADIVDSSAGVNSLTGYTTSLSPMSFINVYMQYSNDVTEIGGITDCPLLDYINALMVDKYLSEGDTATYTIYDADKVQHSYTWADLYERVDDYADDLPSIENFPTDIRMTYQPQIPFRENKAYMLSTYVSRIGNLDNDDTLILRLLDQYNVDYSDVSIGGTNPTINITPEDLAEEHEWYRFNQLITNQARELTVSGDEDDFHFMVELHIEAGDAAISFVEDTDAGTIDTDTIRYIYDTVNDRYKPVKLPACYDANETYYIRTATGFNQAICLDGLMLELGSNLNDFTQYDTESYARYTVIDDRGVSIYNSALTIYDSKGEKVIYANDEGDLKVSGMIEAKEGSRIAGWTTMKDGFYKELPHLTMFDRAPGSLDVYQASSNYPTSGLFVEGAYSIKDSFNAFGESYYYRTEDDRENDIKTYITRFDEFIDESYYNAHIDDVTEHGLPKYNLLPLLYVGYDGEGLITDNCNFYVGHDGKLFARNAKFDEATITDSDIVESRIGDATINDATIIGAAITDANITNSYMEMGEIDNYLLFNYNPTLAIPQEKIDSSVGFIKSTNLDWSYYISTFNPNTGTVTNDLLINSGYTKCGLLGTDSSGNPAEVDYIEEDGTKDVQLSTGEFGTIEKVMNNNREVDLSAYDVVIKVTTYTDSNNIIHYRGYIDKCPSDIDTSAKEVVEIETNPGDTQPKPSAFIGHNVCIINNTEYNVGTDSDILAAMGLSYYLRVWKDKESAETNSDEMSNFTTVIYDYGWFAKKQAYGRNIQQSEINFIITKYGYRFNTQIGSVTSTNSMIIPAGYTFPSRVMVMVNGEQWKYFSESAAVLKEVTVENDGYQLDTELGNQYVLVYLNDVLLQRGTDYNYNDGVIYFNRIVTANSKITVKDGKCYSYNSSTGKVSFYSDVNEKIVIYDTSAEPEYLVNKVSDGETTEYKILSRPQDIVVTVNGTKVSNYTYSNGKVKFNEAPANGAVIVIKKKENDPSKDVSGSGSVKNLLVDAGSITIRAGMIDGEFSTTANQEQTLRQKVYNVFKNFKKGVNSLVGNATSANDDFVVGYETDEVVVDISKPIYLDGTVYVKGLSQYYGDNNVDIVTAFDDVYRQIAITRVAAIALAGAVGASSAIMDLFELVGITGVGLASAASLLLNLKDLKGDNYTPDFDFGMRELLNTNNGALITVEDALVTSVDVFLLENGADRITIDESFSPIYQDIYIKYTHAPADWNTNYRNYYTASNGNGYLQISSPNHNFSSDGPVYRKASRKVVASDQQFVFTELSSRTEHPIESIGDTDYLVLTPPNRGIDKSYMRPDGTQVFFKTPEDCRLALKNSLKILGTDVVSFGSTHPTDGYAAKDGEPAYYAKYICFENGFITNGINETNAGDGYYFGYDPDISYAYISLNNYDINYNTEQSIIGVIIVGKEQAFNAYCATYITLPGGNKNLNSPRFSLTRQTVTY